MDGHERLFGWDDTPGIVSVWADWNGQALVWCREQGRLLLERRHFRPWLYARDPRDIAHLAERPPPADPHAAVRVRELPGAQGSLRFLLDAADGRILRRAVLDGASRRLGRPVRGLSELAGYYAVGPVEQYLMSSGRTFFRGMTFDDLHRLQFDLETTALSPEDGRIFLVAVRDSRGFEAVLEAPGEADEPRLIAQLVQLIRLRDPDVIENHNIMRFDLPFLLARAERCGVRLDLGRPGGPRGVWRVQDGRRSPHFACAGREIVDTFDAARRHGMEDAGVEGLGLKQLARAFGLAAPDRVYLEGAQIARTYAEQPELVRRYALQDVREVGALSERLLAPSFALAGMTPRPYARLPYAGPATGVLEPLLVRAYLRAGTALPGPRPRAAAGHQGGAVQLFAEGVLERVVKADIASLYPSLMRAYRIGPASDSLGVLLDVVDRLTELRLKHKRLAREATPGSREAGEHRAMQAAMKTVINSAYGYLGAEDLALFADRAAADEITRRGREVLAVVVRGLARGGVTLIEADTDGVYFSVPPGWDEPRERELVTRVGRALPAGVTLEFEGRYRAMLSHEVKNYALLTYDGQLVLRGAALRSSRSEPFGDRFLTRALRCLLTGDVPGVRLAYQETLRAVLAHELRCADVATRVRLGKSSVEYARSRAARREAPYEALLAAGRRDWDAGERVAYYRRQDGQSVLLQRPDANDYDAPHYAQTLRVSYAGRLRKAFSAADHAQLFRADAQPGLFDVPAATIRPRWVAVGEPELPGS